MRNKLYLTAFGISVALLALQCGGYTPKGGEGQPCGSMGECNAGLSCHWSVCSYCVCDANDECCDGCAANSGAACQDDGYPCTSDICSGLGKCVHAPYPDACLIDGGCYAEGDLNPADGCMTCKPYYSARQWTPLSPGCGREDGDLETEEETEEIVEGDSADDSINDSDDAEVADDAEQNEEPEEELPIGLTFPEGYCDKSQCVPPTPTGQTMCVSQTSGGEFSYVCPGGSTAACGDRKPLDYCGQDPQYHGQKRSYICSNQNGARQSACSSYPSAGETAYDEITNLTWMRNWTIAQGSVQAATYCASLILEGRDDWRLPTPYEALSIVNYGPDETLGFPGWSEGAFYTTEQGETSGFLWLVTMKGELTLSRQYGYANVRCVRGKSFDTYGTGAYVRFTSSGTKDVIQTDKVTLLQWQSPVLTGKTWSEALYQCETSIYGDFSDWRLPTIKELSSIGRIDGDAYTSDYPGVEKASLWSSTFDKFSGEPLVWAFISGEKKYASVGLKGVAVSEKLSVKCVRGGVDWSPKPVDGDEDELETADNAEGRIELEAHEEGDVQYGGQAYPPDFCKYNQCFLPPPSGQTTCFDNKTSGNCPGGGGIEKPPQCPRLDAHGDPLLYCGQDAEYEQREISYDCLGAGTASTDCWYIPVAGSAAVDNNTKLMWQRGWGPTLSYQEAQAYCDSLKIGGLEDWRLPNVFELAGIVSYGGEIPAADTYAFMDTPPYKFWSGADNYAYAVDFFGGFISFANSDRERSESNFVRCVRGGEHDVFNEVPTNDPPIYFNRFINDQDLGTGLYWKFFNEDKDLELHDWKDALDYCERLNKTRDYIWRLPNAKELLSLWTTWPDLPRWTFENNWFLYSMPVWSSTTYVDEPRYAWASMFSQNMDVINKSQIAVVVCVSNRSDY